MATPKKKSKWPPEGTPKPIHSKGKVGTTAKLSRDSKGNLSAKKGKDFAGVTQATMKADAKTASKTGDKTFTGAPAPRVGGKQKMVGKSGPLKSASKKVIRQSRRKPTGSPAARKSQRRNRF